jgi:hypothetical protein
MNEWTPLAPIGPHWTPLEPIGPHRTTLEKQLPRRTPQPKLTICDVPTAKRSPCCKEKSLHAKEAPTIILNEDNKITVKLKQR